MKKKLGAGKARQGKRTDKELPQNFGEVKKGKETAEIAAEKAGFGNPETYRQAKKVVDKAEPELKDARGCDTSTGEQSNVQNVAQCKGKKSRGRLW